MVASMPRLYSPGTEYGVCGEQDISVEHNSVRFTNWAQRGEAPIERRELLLIKRTRLLGLGFSMGSCAFRTLFRPPQGHRVLVSTTDTKRFLKDHPSKVKTDPSHGTCGAKEGICHQ